MNLRFNDNGGPHFKCAISHSRYNIFFDSSFERKRFCNSVRPFPFLCRLCMPSICVRDVFKGMSANVKNRSTILQGINLQFNFTFWVCRLHNNLWRIPSYGSGFQIIISVTCQKSTTKNIFVIDRGDTLKDLCDSSFICVFLQANDILFLNRILIQFSWKKLQHFQSSKYPMLMIFFTNNGIRKLYDL